MNRRKTSSNIGFPTLILLLVAGAIVATGGISYVVMKNKQITARRSIEKVQDRMKEHQVSITLHEADIEATLSVFSLREYLAEVGSPLREITPGVVEVITLPDVESPPGQAVAQR